MNQLYRVIWVVCLLATAVFFSAPPRPAYAATFVVDSTADAVDANPGNGICATAGNVCTLRAAIQEANALAGADVITLPAGTYTLSLGPADPGANTISGGDLDISEALTITGADTTTTTINGGAIDRVIELITTAGQQYAVTIENLTITNGSIPVSSFSHYGAGIGQRNNTTGVAHLTLNNVIVTGNSNINSGGGIGIFRNGSAMPAPSLTINNSVISNNTAGTSGSGGGIQCAGCALQLNNSSVLTNTAVLAGGGINLSANQAAITTIFNSTISGNSSWGNGGGIAKAGTGQTVTINFSTITNNTANSDSSGAGEGGGVHSTNTPNVTIQNSIVQGNINNVLTQPDCSAANIVSGGYNVVGSTCPTVGTDTTAAANLGALQDNGANTDTHMPGGGSAAINLIPNGSSGCVGGTSVDQRGGVRADGPNRGDTACDSGSVEADSIQQPNAIALQLFSTEANASAQWTIFLFALLVLASLGVMGQRPFGQLARKLANKI